MTQQNSFEIAVANQQEWLETNGMGDRASSTILGMNTRRNHCLLTLAQEPFVDRTLVLSKVDETLVVNGSRYELSCNQYGGGPHPQGNVYLHRFCSHPYPTFFYRVEDLELEKRFCMVYGERTVVTQYRVRHTDAKKPFFAGSLEVRPLLALRDANLHACRNSALNSSITTRPCRATVVLHGSVPAMHFSHDAESVEKTGNWFHGLEYEGERHRGLHSSEYLFNPFVMKFDLHAEGPSWLIASTEKHSILEAQCLQDGERRRRRTTRLPVLGRNSLVKTWQQTQV